MDAWDVLNDLEIHDEAVKAAQSFVEEHLHQMEFAKDSEWPIKRAQLNGLRELAEKEPSKIADFARHQKEKSAKSQDKDCAEAFWDCVEKLLQGRQRDWSLAKAREEARPKDWVNVAKAGKLTPEEERARRQKNEQWDKEWNREVVPAFFRTFCIEIIYQLQKRTKAEKKKPNGSKGKVK
ncbi:MAG: hypothetical protein RMJ16_06015 [Thermoguttaceae bacterium]|nr:hypothetical protein [Thermoguttaceae bacterium]